MIGVRVSPTVNRQKRRGKTFYVALNGNDSNNGRSPSSAWATLAKVANYVSSTGLKINDSVRLRSGDTFNENLYLGTEATQNRSKPYIFSSYGGGSATINLPANNMVYINNLSIFWKRINVVQSNTASSASNQSFLLYLNGGVTVRNFKITDSNFQGSGVCLQLNADATSKLENVLIQGVSISNGIRHGLIINTANNLYECSGRYRYINVSGIVGEGADIDGGTGNGIVIGNHSNSVIENCNVNGIAGSNARANHLIWFFKSRNSIIRDCQAISARGTGFDRSGIGLDIDCGDCTVERNFIWDAWGPGIYLNHGQNNTIRHNVIVDCANNPHQVGAVPWGFSGIFVLGGTNVSGVPPQTNLKVYNNTVVCRAKSVGSVSDPIPFLNEIATNSAIVANNIFYTSQTARRMAENTVSSPNIRFYGNDYFASSGTPQYNTNGTNYSGLSAWRSATGQEVLTGTNYGQETNPLFVNASGNNDIDFKLQSGSSLGSGLDLTALFAINPGLTDYFKNSIASVIPGIGADSGKSVTQYAAPYELTQLLNTSLAYWRLDASPWAEAKGIASYSLGTTGTITTGAALSTGSANSASIGGSTSNLNLSDTSLFHLPNECTIVLPFQKTLSTATNGTATLIGKYDAGANQRGWHLQLEYPSGQSTSEQIQFQYSTNGQSATQVTLNSGYFTPRNGKHLVVFQRSVANNFLRLSIDNGAWVTTTSPASIHQSTARFAIGGRYNSGAASGGLTGLVDNTGIWNYLLTASQLNQFWNSGNFRQL